MGKIVVACKNSGSTVLRLRVSLKAKRSAQDDTLHRSQEHFVGAARQHNRMTPVCMHALL